MTQDKKALPTRKLFWIDMEMTGLDVEKEVIIEVAAIITDLEFNPMDQFEAVVKQPQEYLDRMDEWNTKHHNDSGLVKKIPYGKDLQSVEQSLIQMIKKNYSDTEDRPVLAGNSISQDRLFIDKYMKQLSPLLHYRVLDVSSWKVLFNHKYQRKYEKKNAHRALEDILESLDELKFYTQFIKIS